MANLFTKIVQRFTGSEIQKVIEEKVAEQVNKANAGDVLRFSPSSLTWPDGAIAKTQPLGVSFQTLRDFADFYPIARAAIEYRKSQITHLEFNITPIEMTDETVQDKKNIADAKTIKEFLKRPTGKKDSSMTNWIKQILEDLLVIDAVAIYRRKNRGGKIIGYLPIDGATIDLILEGDGTTPEPPNSAYVQKIHGQERERLTTDELIYAMMTPKTHSAYGFAPLESLIITVTTALKVQAYNLSYLCYDEATEILTKDGWKYFRELTDKDVVATRNKDSIFEWQKPLDRPSFDYDKELIKFKSTTVDLLVTPNHRMLVDYRGPHGKFTKKNIIKRADWFVNNERSKTQNYLAPTTSIWKGEAPEYFEIPSYTIMRDGVFSGYHPRTKKKFTTDRRITEIKKESIQVVINDWMAFLGLYLAEGWTRAENDQSRHEVYIAQSERSRHFKEIKDLLNRLPFKFRWVPSRNLFECSDARLWQYLKQFGHSYNKFIPVDVKNYSVELLKILWEWGIRGDGHISGENYVYSTVSKKLADDYQEVLQKLGKEARISVMYQEVGRIIKGKKNPIRTTLPIYKVFERTSTHRSLYCASKEDYKGKVYSVKVSNGIVYVRRNGIPLWCGNTEGNIPTGFITLPRDIASSRDQLKEWQDAWDAMLAGDPRFQQKLKFLPEGMKYESTIKASDMTFERFEKWLLQTTCSVFGLHPSAIGFNFDVNRATEEVAFEAGRERGLFPTALFLKEIMDRIIQDDLGYEDLEFSWTNIDPTNKVDEAKVVTSLVNSGLMSIDEWRLGEGLKPTGVKDPFILGPVGPIFVKDLLRQSEEGQDPIIPYKPVTNSPKPADTANIPIPSQAKVDSASSLRVDSGDLSADRQDQTVYQEVKKWKKATLNDFKKGQAFRNFYSDIIDDKTQNLIKKGLSGAKTKEEIINVFSPFLNGHQQLLPALLKLHDEIDRVISFKSSNVVTPATPGN